MLKRLSLFLITNFVVLVTIGIIARIFGVDRWLTSEGIDYNSLIVFSAIFGFGGAIVSLLMSKSIAKMSTGAQVLTKPENKTEAWLLDTVEDLSQRAGIKMPEVAIYQGTANAFATGAFRDEALVAVSTGLLQTMTYPQIKAVLAHEISHVKNGDMVTMTLVQGVLNTFVFFFARVLAHIISAARDENGNRRGGIGYFFLIQIFEILFGILATIVACAFSRHREFRADAGAAELLGSPTEMINALHALGQTEIAPLPSDMKAFGIVDLPSFAELFSTHPPLADRIKALSKNQPPAVRKTGGLFANVSDDKSPWN